MSLESPGTVTELLAAIQSGDDAALNQLAQLLHPELHRQAQCALRRERPGHTLQPTDLFDEVFKRLLEGKVFYTASNRAYLFGAAAIAMRRVLVEHARERNAPGAGGGWQRNSLDAVVEWYENKGIDLEALQEALEALKTADKRQYQIVQLYHFGGFKLREIAEMLGVSVATVSNDLNWARKWLFTQLTE
jgi:RNA polymerase sigma factor (TIGR02999 family)